jgi:hypothetical protein
MSVSPKRNILGHIVAICANDEIPTTAKFNRIMDIGTLNAPSLTKILLDYINPTTGSPHFVKDAEALLEQGSNAAPLDKR